MGTSQILSEKTVKRLGLDKKEMPSPDSKVVVKEWNTEEEYWDEWEKNLEEENKKWTKKVRDFFVYTIGWRTRDWWYDTKWYFSNLKRFHKVLKTWRSFDYHYQIDLFKFGIQELAKAKKYYGNEYEEHCNKKIEAMNALVAEIERDYEEDVRQRLNYSYKSGGKVTEYADGSVCFHGDDSKERGKETKRYYAEVAKERKLHYQKIFDLIIGQDNDVIEKEIRKRFDALQDKPKKGTPEYSELYAKFWNEVWDGSGIEGWWD